MGWVRGLRKASASPQDGGQGEARKFAVIHLPKTAGTSLNALLEARLGADFAVLSPSRIVNFYDMVAGCRVLSGHLPYFVYRWGTVPRELVTVIRHPVDRIVSNYKFILAEPGHYAHDYVVKRRLSLRDCFEHPVLRQEFVDFQTRMLGWSPSEEVALPALGLRAYESFWREWNAFLYGVADRATLQRALARLSQEIRFAVLGDRDSILGLASLLVGAPVLSLPHENKTPPVDYRVTAADLEEIKRNNGLDQELYDFAWRQSPLRWDPAPPEKPGWRARLAETLRAAQGRERAT
jgi:hypothetical protein